jgi:hypothetical protein
MMISKRWQCLMVLQSLFLLAWVSVDLFVSKASSAELPTIEVGLPKGGMFGLGGAYVIDKGLDRKNGFIIKPPRLGSQGFSL